MKTLFKGFLLLSGLALGLPACKQVDTVANEVTYVKLRGETMGTYYAVTYRDSLERDLQSGIDSVLVALNLEVSTYIDSSVISRVNQSADGMAFSGNDKHFIRNLIKSREIFILSDGAFDPTVMPLVNYWGFGYTGKDKVNQVDSLEAERLKSLVGLAALVGLDTMGPGRLSKPKQEVQLDFSAIAKGYGVDLVGTYLRDQGIVDFLVDIGGESLASGKSPRGGAWRIGINIPSEEAALNALYSSLELTDKAMATSGNYRNLYEVNGVKYSHTINPKTGYPERRRLLSASIIASDCMTADALATTCMVIGVEKAKELIGSLSGVDAYLIFSAEDGTMTDWSSPGMSSYSLSR